MPYDDRNSFGSRRVLISIAILSAASVGTALVALEVRSRNVGASSTVRSCDVIPDKPWWRWAACTSTPVSNRDDADLPGSATTTSSLARASDTARLPENFAVDWSDLARPFDSRAPRSGAAQVSAPGSKPSRDERAAARVDLPKSDAVPPTETIGVAARPQVERAAGSARGQIADETRAAYLPDASGLIVVAETQARLSSLSELATLPSVPDAAMVLASVCNSGSCGEVPSVSAK